LFRLQISSEGRRLHVTNVVIPEAGLYTCVASNRAGESSLEFDVEVLCTHLATERCRQLENNHIAEYRRLYERRKWEATLTNRERSRATARPIVVVSIDATPPPFDITVERHSTSTTVRRSTTEPYMRRSTTLPRKRTEKQPTYYKKPLLFQKEMQPWDPDYQKPVRAFLSTVRNDWTGWYAYGSDHLAHFAHRHRRRHRHLKSNKKTPHVV
jgi:hypothetical protein